jgi:hypothetical protein
MATFTNDDSGSAVPPNSQSVPGPFTVQGDLTVTGAESVGANLTVAGSATVGSAVVTGNETVGGSLGVTGAITPSQTNGVVGTTTNNDANAGSVGEFKSATLAIGSAIFLPNDTQTNVLTLSLPAGDWECGGVLSFKFAATTSYTNLAYGLSLSTAVLGTDAVTGRFATPAAVPGAMTLTFPLPMVRFSLAATTTIYLVGYCFFSVSTITVFGHIRARRVR